MKKGHHEMQTLPQLFDHIVATYSRKTALLALDSQHRRQYSFANLSQQVAATRGWLAGRGIGKGAHVVVCSENNAETLVLMLACAQQGAVAVPVDLKVSLENLNHIIMASGPRLVATTRREVLERFGHVVDCYFLGGLFEDCLGHEAPAEATELCGDDLLFLFFTSGTTGQPKGVRITHRNLVANVTNVAQMENLDRSDRILSMAPLCHAMGLTMGLFIPWFFGNTIIHSTSLRSDVMLRILQEEGVTAIVSVPVFLDRGREKIEQKLRSDGRLEQFESLQRHARRLPMVARRLVFRQVLNKMAPRLRWVAVGGAPLRPETELFWEALGVQIVKGYGLTETLIASCSGFSKRRLGSVGLVVPGQELHIDEQGEIWLRGPNVMDGYDRAEDNEHCFRDGWFRTGDIGRLDEQGYLFITGRSKNVIIGPCGINIYPEDIEQVLAEDHRIADCLVVESMDRAGDLWAVVVVAACANPQEALQTVLPSLNSRLSAHQQLKRLLLWHEVDFPRTNSQKIRKQAVLEQLAEGRPQSPEEGQSHQA
jgi:long-chain acyl-CoA synthetase